MQRGNEAAFHELVRILEALPQMSAAVAVGHQGPSAQEGIRFAPALDLSFGANEVDDIVVDDESGQFTIKRRDRAGDFFGRLARGLRQVFHLVRQHHETASMRPGTRRLDRGI